MHIAARRPPLAALVFAVIGTASPAAAQSSDPPRPTTVDASRGGITISSGVNSLTIGARLQVRWTLEDREAFDGDTAGAGDGRADGPLSQFDVPRMRVSFTGGVYRPWLRYEFQFDFSRTSGEGASKIKDAVIEIRPAGGATRVRAGQFKVPFGLQQLTSSGRLQFVDRAITDSKFTPSRDMGVMAGRTFANGRMGVEAGLFNGAGESARQKNRAHLWAGRLFVQPLGTYALSEGTSDAGERPVLHVGVGVRGGKQIRGRTPAAVVEEVDDQTAANVEFALKRPRFFTTAEYFWMRDEQRNPLSGPSLDSRGFHAQAGYMVLPPRLELGLLYARVTPDTGTADADLTEVRAVAGYYWERHSLKLQADIGELRYGPRFGALSSRAQQGLPPPGARLVSGRGLADSQVRLQIQVAF